MKLAIKILSSYGLSLAVLGAMFVVVLFGTYYQVDHGIHEAQVKFFDSWFFDFAYADGVYVPFPGGLLLMTLLTINLIVGGILRLKRTWSRVGILICHVGIVVLMAAGLVKFASSVEGGIQLYEGEQTAWFVSYHELEVAVVRNKAEGGREEWVIDHEYFRDLDDQGERSFTLKHADLPFELRLDRLIANGRVEQEGLRPAKDVVTPIVGGFYVMPRLRDKVSEKNAAACYAVATTKDGAKQAGILSQLAGAPWSFEVDGTRYGVELRRRQYDLPFTIELADFERKVHPTSGRPLSFQSDVVVRERGSKRELQKTRIAMNKPLRRDGYVFFQSSWGPENAKAGQPLFSIFSVVNNPSDQWPLYACIITTLGMLIHFGLKLYRYLLDQVRGSSRPSPVSPKREPAPDTVPVTRKKELEEVVA